jgi:hypothetical protein
MIRALVLGMLVFAGCGSGPCDRLQSQCDACKDKSKKDACDQVVKLYRSSSGGDLSCQALLDAHSYDSC